MVRWNAWNLLLLVPLLALFTPIYNRVEPRLFGLPFYYWFQLFGLVFVVGVTLLVHRATNETEFEKYAEPDDDDLPPMARSNGPRFPHFPDDPDFADYQDFPDSADHHGRSDHHGGSVRW